MRRVLLDENLPRKLRREMREFAIRTVQEQFQNGELTRFDIGVVVIVTVSLRFRVIVTALDDIRRAIAEVQPGRVIQVQVPSGSVA